MAVLVDDCPHCGASKITFTFHGSVQRQNSRIWNTLFVCRNCEEGIVVTFLSPQPGLSPGACHGDPRTDEFTVMAIHPPPAELGAPPHVPSDLADEYVEGL